MVEHDNLRTASVYINNQLLSRGLLRDGETIDFTDPSRGDGGAEATMGRIIGVVNDLILRRDRDAQQRESLSATLRTLRAEGLRQTDDITRLKEKHTDVKRKLDISEASETAVRTQLKSAESAARGLKEEMARAKALVAQTRLSCATEIRRRDRQLDGLKKQLGEAGRARGSVRSAAVTVINVTGDFGAEKPSPSAAGSTNSAGYDLRSETNEFLTELARNLSEENESILVVLRRMRDELKSMSGWDKGASQGDGHAVSLVSNCDELASDLEAILEHLKNILTNPSFVPIEEVVVREDEIGRLREGWVKMETRWKEAVHLIDGWRKRMAASGRPVNMEELQMGLRLSPVRVRDVAETAQGMDLRLSPVHEEQDEESIQALPSSPSPLAESLNLVPAPPEYEDPESESESSIYEDDIEIDEYDVEEPNVQILQQSTALMDSVSSLPPLPPPPQISPLRDSGSAGNRGTATAARSRRKAGDFTTIIEESTRELAADAQSLPQLNKLRRGTTAPQPQTRPAARPAARQPKEPQHHVPASLADSSSSLDSLLLAQPVNEKPRRARTDRTVRVVKPAVSRPTQSAPSLDQEQQQQSSSRQETEQPRRPARDEQATPQHSRTRSPSPRKVSSRLPLPRNANPAPQQSPLTMAAIAAKLAASERDADAARVRAKLKAARMAKAGRPSLAPSVPVEEEPAEGGEGEEPVKRDPVVPPTTQDEEGGADAGTQEEGEKMEEVAPKRKRERRVSKAASRRRSTLSPWELESLITGGVAVAT